MKIPALEQEGLRHVYDSLEFKQFYPHRIVCPLGYFDPKYHALIMLTCSEHSSLTPNEERAIYLALKEANNPTYFVAPDFLQAVWNTDPKDGPPLEKIHFPLDAMLLVLPDTISKNIFFNFSVPFVSYTLKKASDSDSLLLLFHASLFPSDGKPLGYYGKVPIKDGTYRSIQGYPYRDDYETVEEYVQENVKDDSGSFLKHEPNTILPTKEQDLILVDRVYFLLYKLFVVLNCFHHSHSSIITQGEMVRKPNGPPSGKGYKSALYSPCFIGSSYRPKNKPLGGTHASPRLHWRRGHIRKQHYGPSFSLLKTIWIEPVLVNINKEPLAVAVGDEEGGK